MVFERASLSDLVTDRVIYRNLEPVDPRLPRLAEVCRTLGLDVSARPRKHEPAYAQVLTSFLRHAHALERRTPALAELVYLGDTAMSDGNAFRNLRAAGGWRGWCFIGAERDEELAIAERDGVYVANRWSALAEFASWLRNEGATLDGRTAVILDVDKTALGARGRNDAAIDRARVVAIEATVAEALGLAFDQATFRRAYAAINVSKYHPFTADNQDYVAYVCLMVSAGVVGLAELLREVDASGLTTFAQFIGRLEVERARLPAAGLRSLHDDIYRYVQAGDPTPFKAFRRREYRETVSRMGHLSDDAPLARLLVEEICLTQEVVDFARWLRGRGCLLLALSDKPDEATAPDDALAAQGWLPLHRAATHVVGQSIVDLLPDD
jgi:hypothetical protein